MADVASQIMAAEIATAFDRARHAIDIAAAELRRMDELNRKLAERLEAKKGEENGGSRS